MITERIQGIFLTQRSKLCLSFKSPELAVRFFTTSANLEALSYLQVGKNKCYKWFKYKVIFDKTKSLQFIKKEGVCDELKVLEKGHTRPSYDAVWNGVLKS